MQKPLISEGLLYCLYFNSTFRNPHSALTASHAISAVNALIACSAADGDVAAYTAWWRIAHHFAGQFVEALHGIFGHTYFLHLNPFHGFLFCFRLWGFLHFGMSRGDALFDKRLI